MWPAFPAPDYYGPSAPTRRHQPATRLPYDPCCGRGGGRRVGSHVHSRFARRGRCPALPLRPRHAYPAALQRGLPAGDIEPAQESPANIQRACTAAQPRSARFELVGSLRGVTTLVPHVHLSVSLAGPEPSGSTSPSRRCRGCFPPSPASPGSGCPQLHQAAATAQRRSSHISARSHGASWRTMSSCHSCRGRSTRKKPGRFLRSVGRRRWISCRSRITRSTPCG